MCVCVCYVISFLKKILLLQYINKKRNKNYNHGKHINQQCCPPQYNQAVLIANINITSKDDPFVIPR